MKPIRTIVVLFLGIIATLVLPWPPRTSAQEPPSPSSQVEPSAAEPQLLSMLDAPLLFVKRHSYTGIHIYDTFYKWPPGGGGIYVLENPSAPRSQWKIRPIIDPTTPATLGVGVYTHPELSWDAKRLLFCFKGEPQGSTSIYEIGIDGQGLRRVTDPTSTCNCYKGSNGGQHDIAPAYLADGRIVFLSTRPSGLVPCANEGVSILHVMNADGSDIHPISVNNVNEFDPSLLPDGRILFGRWEYVDKNALTIQSLWTVNPDGTNETALFANNMVFPEAILDARPVPGSHLIVGTFAKHNAPPRGSIAFVDPHRGKNGTEPIFNLEHRDQPTFDLGDSCEPWPLSEDVVLLSGRPKGAARNAIEIMDREGHRAVVLSDPDICLHSPMLVKPRPCPPPIVDTTDRLARSGRFFLQDIYRGLSGVQRGEVKWLRVIEETSRVSPTPGGGNPYNQTFLVSSALAFSVKNILGVVPVKDDGSAYFEVPSGRAIYLQALDEDGRLVQSMRTFVQAAPGTTRSCIGCHEHKASTATNDGLRGVLSGSPSQLQPESWGSGYLDYPSMVQPVLDKHCVSCHGGEKDIAAGMDLSGGWTEHFNISYENLTSRRETQLIAYWIAGIDCMNGTALWSSQIFAPRNHGSGAAPLARMLVEGHGGRLADLDRRDRDLLLAWIDTNGLYYGTWDYTKHGCALSSYNTTRDAIVAEMRAAGCLRCHGDGTRVAYFESDWINLKDPQLSRILRAPLAKDGGGFGLAMCRDRKVDPNRQRIRLLCNGYAHAVQPPEAFPRQTMAAPDTGGEPIVTFTSTTDAHYQAMLSILRRGRDNALAAPRADMPGAEVLAGACRQFNPPPLPPIAPPIEAKPDAQGVVHLAWERSARTVGLEAELHRSAQPGFTPDSKTLLTRTSLFRYEDATAPEGRQFYALQLVSGDQRSQPFYTAVVVPPPAAPPAPADLKATAWSSTVRLSWQSPQALPLAYHVYRSGADNNQWQRITAAPIRQASYADTSVQADVAYRYVVRALSQRGVESEPTNPATACARFVKEPVFAAAFDHDIQARLANAEVLPAMAHGNARIEGGVLDLRQGGHVTFPHHSLFDLDQQFSVECWVCFDEPGPAAVVVGCGAWQQAGWFLQRLGSTWRWHVGTLDCDGGQTPLGRWIHLAGTFDGQTARLFQDGLLVAEKIGPVNTAPWPGELHIGQYSAQPATHYQVIGRIAGVKLYHRPLAPSEVTASANTKPQ